MSKLCVPNQTHFQWHAFRIFDSAVQFNILLSMPQHHYQNLASIFSSFWWVESESVWILKNYCVLNRLCVPNNIASLRFIWTLTSWGVSLNTVVSVGPGRGLIPLSWGLIPLKLPLKHTKIWKLVWWSVFTAQTRFDHVPMRFSAYFTWSLYSLRSLR